MRIIAEELIPKEPKLFNIRVETPRNKAFYEKVDNIAKSVEKTQNYLEGANTLHLLLQEHWV